MAMIEATEEPAAAGAAIPTATPDDDPAQTSKGVNWRRGLVVAADFIGIAVGLLTTKLIAEGSGISWVLASFFGVMLWLAMLSLNLYNSRLVTARSEELTRVARAGVRAMLALGVIAVVFGLGLELRSAVVALVCTVASVSLVREGVRLWFSRRRRAGYGLWASVLVAGTEEGAALRSTIEMDKSSPHAVVDHVDPRHSNNADALLTETLAAARQSGAHGAIVVESLLDAQTANSLVRGLLEAGLYVDLASNLVDISADRLATRSLGSTIATWIAPRPRGGWRGRAKRLFDVAVAGVVLTLISPIFAGLAVAVKLTSKGPVFFRQERVGRYGEPFKMIKFRSMVVDAEEKLRELAEANEGSGPLFKMKDDPRVTPLGRIMRKTSLDELPQLLNVLLNEMSLVGPRPALREEMADWDPALYARLQVKPGITGMWQVSGRSGTSFEEYTRLDLYYVNNWSLFVDLAIMAKTIPAVVKSDGAF